MLADRKARKKKKRQHGVRMHDKQRGCNIITLHNMLMDKTFKTSPYKTFTVFDPKEREISCLPYYPDRIHHHGIMNKLESMFVSHFTADTYSCIKGKGIHSLKTSVEKALRQKEDTTYCLKLDVRKFYPSINHDILKTQLLRKIKDADLLGQLFEIIDSAPGVPIGNYLSQYFANFYLSRFDHWLKEVVGVAHYWRYADDMVFVSGSIDYLRGLLKKISEYLAVNLKLEIKDNWQIFPVAARGIDFGGYRFFHGYTWMRKGIKKSLCRVVARRKKRQLKAGKLISANPAEHALRGWAKHANTINLLNKLNLSLNINDEHISTSWKESDKEDRVHRRENNLNKGAEPKDSNQRLPDCAQQFRRRTA